MAPKDNTPLTSRRGFLTLSASGAVGGAAAVLAATGAAGTASAASSPAADTQDDGYRETDHVRTYYERARF